MKMIYVGSLSNAPDRDSGWIREFIRLGWDVVPFGSLYDVSSGVVTRKLKKRFHFGIENRMMQEALLARVVGSQPKWVHFRLPIGFDRTTIEAIRGHGVHVTQYFNDDPFSPRSPFGLHWKFRQALTAYDGHFVYRQRNVESYRRAGAVHVEHCPPTYDQERHTTAKRRADGGFYADAAFMGHCEDDWRVDCLDALYAAGFNVIVKGSGWDRAFRGRKIAALSPVGFAHGEEYNDIYANVAAGLCFFSKINRDTWTERALEIVAVGGVLVCERTEEAQSYFLDKEEAFFFSSVGELVAICRLLKTNQALRERVRKAGYARLLQGNHSVSARAAQIHEWAMAHVG